MLDVTKFTLERDSNETERGFLRALWNNPNDQAARSAYGDWLEEQGRSWAAAAVRFGETPGGTASTEAMRREVERLREAYKANEPQGLINVPNTNTTVKWPETYHWMDSHTTTALPNPNWLQQYLYSSGAFGAPIVYPSIFSTASGS